MATELIQCLLYHAALLHSYSFLAIISYLHIITSRLKAGILEQETFAARQWLGKHDPAATNAYATIEELMERCFLYSPR
jgi:hypothetical protein